MLQDKTTRMDHALHFAGVSGSLRKGSYNTMLIREASKLLPAHVTMDILSIESIPLYNADNDLPAASSRPAAVEQFREALAKADAIVIASPEYNYGIPGVLKNALDWASRGKDSPLLKKPVALMGATQGLWGTVRMQMAFQSLYLYMDMKPVHKPEILIAQASKKFDENGNLTDETTRELIKQQLIALKDMCQSLRAAA